jgi:hypothetical protein
MVSSSPRAHRGASIARSFGALLAALLAIGCGDITDSVGEQGRLRFSLATSYEVEESELRDATIVAGHAQHIDVELTNKGEDDIEEPDEITYRFRLSTEADADVSTQLAGGDDPPDVEVNVHRPGTYELEALYKGKVVDAIELSFDSPDSLEIALQIRRPYDDDFDPVSGTSVQIEEGTQAVFLPIPKKGTQRLVGSILTEVSATPRELVVPGEGASFVAEQGVWSAEGNIDFYFIDPGMVTVTISDPVSKASGSFNFEVTDAN